MYREKEHTLSSSDAVMVKSLMKTHRCVSGKEVQSAGRHLRVTEPIDCVTTTFPWTNGIVHLVVLAHAYQATVRSSTLGGDLYTTVTRAKRADDAADDLAAAAVREAAATSAANATERENLVRVLGSILRSKPPAHTAACDNARRLGSPAPSSNVPGVTTTKDAKDKIVTTAGQLKLAEALISFLPPAREDGTEGVTTTSVSLRPKWLAPPAVTGNVCVCLLHLLDGEGSGHIATQVIFLEAGGASPHLAVAGDCRGVVWCLRSSVHTNTKATKDSLHQ